MDSSEALVAEALTHLGFKDVLYEPDGNIPPDFLVNGRIAVEVRRLNQNYRDGEVTEGLEQAAISLWHRIKNLLQSLGPPVHGRSWFVFYKFSRPVEPWRALKPKLTTVLKSFIADEHPTARSFQFGSGLHLEIFEASKPYPTLFVPGGHVDEESGGWLLHELEKNLRFCIDEKSAKIAAFRSKYPEWWLVLPDHIGYGLDSFDQELFRDHITISHDWSRILLIDPRNPKRIFCI
jgi:hypothetical protein